MKHLFLDTLVIGSSQVPDLLLTFIQISYLTPKVVALSRGSRYCGQANMYFHTVKK